MVASIGESTLWRWLTEDAIRPWSRRSWIFPRDPDFERKASRVLDLYISILAPPRQDLEHDMRSAPSAHATLDAP